MSSHSSLAWRLSQLLLKRVAWQPTRSPASTEEGLSLLECLMAIVVVLLTVTMITPPLYIAAATRVLHRRAEQANQIAQGEIDRIRTLVATGDHFTTRLPGSIGDDEIDTFEAVAAPATATPAMRSIGNCPNPYNDEAIPTGQALRIDVDGDCRTDYLMQVFRNNGTTSLGETRPASFDVGVRVYSFVALADQNGTTLRPGLETQRASLSLTSGQGSQKSKPLAVIYDSLYWSEDSSTLCDSLNPGSCN